MLHPFTVKDFVLCPFSAEDCGCMSTALQQHMLHCSQACDNPALSCCGFLVTHVCLTQRGWRAWQRPGLACKVEAVTENTGMQEVLGAVAHDL